MRLRTGRKVGRTIYEMVGSNSSDADLLIGLMDTRELAVTVVEAVNEREFVNAELARLRQINGELTRHLNRPRAGREGSQG